VVRVALAYASTQRLGWAGCGELQLWRGALASLAGGPNTCCRGKNRRPAQLEQREACTQYCHGMRLDANTWSCPHNPESGLEMRAVRSTWTSWAKSRQSQRVAALGEGEAGRQ